MSYVLSLMSIFSLEEDYPDGWISTPINAGPKIVRD